MQYTVIESFADLQDNNHVYHPGDKFPRDGMEVTAARLSELSGTGNRVGKQLIKAEIVKKKATKREK